MRMVIMELVEFLRKLFPKLYGLPSHVLRSHPN